MSETQRILVAMSGGVDSSTAAWLLLEAGHHVEGAFLSRGDASSEAAAGHARRTAQFLEIPFHVVDASADFDTLIRHFCSEYLSGRTPNPCILCNEQIKFRRLLERADALALDLLATGHYVRSERRGSRWCLRRGADASKDQSYYLSGLSQKHLSRALFVLGGRTKESVRRLAREAALPAADRDESQDACFVPDADYARLVRERMGDRVQPGDIVDTDGNVVGRHEGIIGFTVGQRRGVKVAMGRPVYVVDVDPDTNRVVVGTEEHLLTPGCTCDNVNWVSVPPPAGPVQCSVQVRYRSKPVPATITVAGRYRVHLNFDEPQRAVAPGQAAVFYHDDLVLGGGWITRER